MTMSGAVHKYRAPYSIPQAADEAGTTKGPERDREGKRVARTNEGGEDTGAHRGGKGKGKDRPVTSPLLPEQRPARRRDKAGATIRWNKRIGRGGGEI